MWCFSQCRGHEAFFARNSNTFHRSTGAFVNVYTRFEIEKSQIFMLPWCSIELLNSLCFSFRKNNKARNISEICVFSLSTHHCRSHLNLWSLQSPPLFANNNFWAAKNDHKHLKTWILKLNFLSKLRRNYSPQQLKSHISALSPDVRRFEFK